MMNYLQPGEHITLAAAPAAVESGHGVLAGKLFGIAAGAAEAGAEVVIATVGVFRLDKVVGESFAVGADVNYDLAVSACTTSATGTTRIGVAVAAAGAGTTEVEVRLSGAW